MDLGATICTPKTAGLRAVSLDGPCAARKRGDQETFPRKAPKAEGRLRRGAAFVVLRADGALLAAHAARQGPARRMTEVPTTAMVA